MIVVFLRVRSQCKRKEEKLTIVLTVIFIQIRVVGNGLNFSMCLDLRLLCRSLYAIYNCGEMSLLSYTLWFCAIFRLYLVITHPRHCGT